MNHPEEFPKTVAEAADWLEFVLSDDGLAQTAVLDLGHEEPTILLTNPLERSSATPIGCYAKRMIIENGIADAIDFFHMDALSSTVAMKSDCDLVLTLMASSRYRLLESGSATATNVPNHATSSAMWSRPQHALRQTSARSPCSSRSASTTPC